MSSENVVGKTTNQRLIQRLLRLSISTVSVLTTADLKPYKNGTKIGT